MLLSTKLKRRLPQLYFKWWLEWNAFVSAMRHVCFSTFAF